MIVTFQHLHKISPNIDKAFQTFYDTLLNDMHFSNFFDSQEQVAQLIEKQKIYFNKALSMPLEKLKIGYIKLGEYHYDIRIPYIDFMKGMEILEESFLVYAQTQTQTVALMNEIFRYFKLIKAQTAEGYLNRMLDEDEKDIEVFFENLKNNNDELSREIVFERINWLKTLIHAIKNKEDFEANVQENEFKLWSKAVNLFDVEKKTIYRRSRKANKYKYKEFILFFKKGDFLEILPLYSSLLGIYKLTLLLSSSVSITVNDYIISNLKIDKLTNLYRKEAFEQFLEKELADFRRNQNSFSVAFFDVDNFKGINDNYGHWSGDKALEKIGEAINKNIRGSDIGCRIGGDEFAIILKGATKEDALKVCKTIKAEVSEFEFIYNDKVSFHIDVSVGIHECTEVSELCSIEDIVKSVDSKLYEAKENGKGQIFLF